MGDTKERIMLASLRLFALRGYEGVSVSDIAGELGITKGALYRHFRNKQDILDSIVRRMEERDAEKAEEFQLPAESLEADPESYCGISPESFTAFSRAMFRYWTQDEFASSFRRMLTLEQFRTPLMGRLYQQYLASGPLGYVTDLFSTMGIPDPGAAALEFYAPMFMLYSVYDGEAEQGGGQPSGHPGELAERFFERAEAHLAALLAGRSEESADDP